MPHAIAYSRVNVGIEAQLVTVEADISAGLPKFSIVGLADTAVKESKHRVRSALLNCQFEFPSRCITVNLAPADLPKDSGRFDLAIALSMLAASRQLASLWLLDYECAAELSLSGELRPISGILPAAIAAKQANKTFIVARENAEEAAFAGDVNILAAQHLLDICQHLKQKKLIELYRSKQSIKTTHDYPDFSQVRGQQQAKRALEIAAAGQHNVLMFGPPGTGKTMLANRLPGILPVMSYQHALETAAIASICGKQTDTAQWLKRPFCHPHHTTSAAALVGGGRPIRPGEISLAHNGVLFLDELAEFHRPALEALREPLEARKISVVRTGQRAEFPANFQLIAATNPCPCGHLGNPNEYCRCTPEQIKRYHARLSGPLLDRIDLFFQVGSLPAQLLLNKPKEPIECSAAIRQRVMQARDKQLQRQQQLNSELASDQLSDHCRLTKTGEALLSNSLEKLKLSGRSYYRILRIARTIADLFDKNDVTKTHSAEALSYRYQNYFHRA